MDTELHHALRLFLDLPNNENAYQNTLRDDDIVDEDNDYDLFAMQALEGLAMPGHF